MDKRNMSMDLHSRSPNSNPSNSNPIPSSNPTSSSHHASNNPSPISPFPSIGAATSSASDKGCLHRRSISDLTAGIPEISIEYFQVPTGNEDEFGSEEDFFSTYIDVENLGFGGCLEDDDDPGVGVEVVMKDSIGTEVGNCNGGRGRGRGGDGEKDKRTNVRHRHRHRRGISLDSNEIVESKKAMPPNKLAELWALDPKRAKRIVANRLSASRSKERKARYILELEQKIHSLGNEATTLSTQLTLYLRDTAGLTAENSELKHWLQSMEDEAELRDALNQALKHEVERLKLATGEKTTATPQPVCAAALHPMPYHPLSSPSVLCQPLPGIQYMPPRLLHPASPQPHTELVKKGPLDRLHGIHSQELISDFVHS